MWQYGLAILGGTAIITLIFGKSICKSVKSYVSKKIVNMVLDSKFESDNKSETEFKIHPNNLSATIIFKQFGKIHRIHFPYDKSLVSKMSGVKVKLIKGDEVVDITQKPGIPYLISAKQMSGDKIIIEKEFNEEDEDNNIIEFDEDEIPNFDDEHDEVNGNIEVDSYDDDNDIPYS